MPSIFLILGGAAVLIFTSLAWLGWLLIALGVSAAVVTLLIILGIFVAAIQ